VTVPTVDELFVIFDEVPLPAMMKVDQLTVADLVASTTVDRPRVRD
jgi:hypothetical protein